MSDLEMCQKCGEAFEPGRPGRKEDPFGLECYTCFSSIQRAEQAENAVAVLNRMLRQNDNDDTEAFALFQATSQEQIEAKNARIKALEEALEKIKGTAEEANSAEDCWKAVNQIEQQSFEALARMAALVDKKGGNGEAMSDDADDTREKGLDREDRCRKCGAA